MKFLKWFERKKEAIKIDNIDLTSDEVVSKISDNTDLENSDLEIDTTNTKEETGNDENIIEVKDITKEMILEKYDSFKKNNLKLDYENNFLDIYSYPFKDDPEFINTVNELKIGLDVIGKNTTDLVYKMKVLEDYDFNNSDDIKRNYDLLESSSKLQRNLLDGFKSCNDEFFGRLSMASISVVVSKDNSGMVTLNKNISSILKENNSSLKRAYEYVYYHSGELIDKLITKLVDCVKASLKENSEMYKKNYFLNSDYVITLQNQEWITLYHKVKSVYNLLNDADSVVLLGLKKLYDEFEACCLVILLYEESLKLEAKNKSK